MGKKVILDKHAIKELEIFREEIRDIFDARIESLKELGRLQEPEAKKIGRNIFEIRVSVGGAYRGLYAYVQKDWIVILHIFQKKTQKTPKQAIQLALKRFKKYESTDA